MKRAGILIGLFYLLSFANSQIISTTTGDVKGTTIEVLGQEMTVFRGIPYAEPPLGELRFKPPIPINRWDGVYNATQNLPTCMQIPCLTNCSEDCLYLNIWVPKNRSNSVMVWFYGGAFMFGSINDKTSDGSVISAMGGVIFVAINYRLGPFGFLCSETDDARGNMGMKDQVLGLRWIKENINAFGGNCSQITIFGISAGAISVSTHLVSPLTRDLFKSAIMQSGSAYLSDMIVRNSSLMKWRSTKLAVTIDCAKEGEDIARDPKVMKCMREQSASSIIVAETAVINSILVGKDNPWLALFTPLYGDDYLPNHPIQEMSAGNMNVNNIMIGNVIDEGSPFLLIFAAPELGLIDCPLTTKSQAVDYITTLFRGLNNPPPKNVSDYYLGNVLDSKSLLKRAYDSVGDWVFACPSVFLSEIVSNNGKNVYYYLFSHRWSRSPNRKWMGVAHGVELPFVFGFPLIDESSYTFEEKEFSKELINAWTSFAKEEKPIYTKLPGEWPRYSSGSRLAVDLNPYNVSYKNPYKDACRFWNDYF